MTLLDNVRSNNISNVENALKHLDFTQRELNAAFHEACARGHVRLVELFLKDTRVDPASPSDLAAEYSYAPSITYSFGLQEACYNGHAEVVELLLKDQRSDPAAGNYRCFQLVVKKALSQDNYAAIVKMLTQACLSQYKDYHAGLDRTTCDKIDTILNAQTSPAAQSLWTYQ